MPIELIGLIIVILSIVAYKYYMYTQENKLTETTPTAQSTTLTAATTTTTAPTTTSVAPTQSPTTTYVAPAPAPAPTPVYVAPTVTYTPPPTEPPPPVTVTAVPAPTIVDITSRLVGTYAYDSGSQGVLWIHKVNNNTIRWAELNRDATVDLIINDGGWVLQSSNEMSVPLNTRIMLKLDALNVSMPPSKSGFYWRISNNPNL